MIANKFVHQFTPPPNVWLAISPKDSSNRQFHQLPLTGTPSFTPACTKEAIRIAKWSKAIGPDGMSTLCLKKLAHGSIICFTNIFNLSISTGRIPEIWFKMIIIPIRNPEKTTTSAGTGAQLVYCAQRPNRWNNSCCPKYWHTSTSTLLNMAFGRNTRHALYCRRSLPTSQEKSWLTEQYSSRSIWQLHSTMWTINNCSIVSTMSTYRQHSVAGSMTICRTEEPKFILDPKHVKAERWKQSSTRRRSYSSALN